MIFNILWFFVTFYHFQRLQHWPNAISMRLASVYLVFYAIYNIFYFPCLSRLELKYSNQNKSVIKSSPNVSNRLSEFRRFLTYIYYIYRKENNKHLTSISLWFQNVFKQCQEKQNSTLSQRSLWLPVTLKFLKQLFLNLSKFKKKLTRTLLELEHM